MSETIPPPLPPTSTISLPLSVPSDPNYTYPPSTMSLICKEQLLESKVTHHALIIPAKLTAQIRKSLSKTSCSSCNNNNKNKGTASNLLISRPKTKDIYPLIQPDDVMDGVDPKSERKIVFASVVIDNDEDDDKADDASSSIYEHELVKPLLESKNGNGNGDRATTTATANNNSDNQNLYTNIRKSTHEIIINYDHYTVEQVLSKVLPPTLLHEIPSSFEVVGNIAHLNLRDEYLPYKYIIGRVILDKNKSIQVCVNKIGTIQNEFRTFPMEIIADDRRRCRTKVQEENDDNDNMNDDTKSSSSSNDGALLEVDVKEDGCKFRLDFEKVYWNSRLQHEHRRIVHLIGGRVRLTNAKQRQSSKRKGKKGNANIIKNNNNNDHEHDHEHEHDGNAQEEQPQEVVVADACAGIGPFAIPLTSQYSHIKVYANDLNPVSYKYLNINSQINKCDSTKLHTYNMDGRYFLRKLDDEGITYHHVLMNLPAIAPEFLNVFRGWKGKKGNNDDEIKVLRPFIHVHCFGGKGEGADEEAMSRCSRSLGCPLDKTRDEVTVHIVRDISPKKNMLCVSFRLPEGVQDLQRVDVFGPVTNESGNEDGDGKDEVENGNDMKKEEPHVKRARTS